jgi:ABC-2 type transport system ATP-binding protein
VLTTHYMEEAELLADRIAVIADGEIVAEGTAASLRRRSRMAAEITFTVPEGVEQSQLPVALGAISIDRGGRARVGCEDPVPALFALTQWALRHKHPLPDLELRRPTLEDVYLQLTTTAGRR